MDFLTVGIGLAKAALILYSLVSVAGIVERVLVLRRTGHAEETSFTTLRALAAKSDAQSALDASRDSDDQSNLWINEQLVWMSSEFLKQWQTGEGMRRGHLKKGRNRVLIRLENGWMGTDTSLLFSFAT